ncbi:hypothetical protein EMIHUDRAFT_226145 [Emiliania huxleyi CCMP1516]|uniref:RecA family profile 1 domain-containing protein n=2 Tax=Emiliania huxleyi TaxID=2903 RepID=A0A0D3KLP6_EMIH1|nr:hypothetical protein EMIHUDRAFT_226145 [Emiliania huxleyi CCMP1516]EOD36681.1 hypothetical protein EMIHUDRAFT_226145 [Emiliania huxleyi CCMP1516]|eukprot:XP_005789110.1 hypothetical protein EMIHUDRAFT_226145 [Emiliania huxleyi CCMP1516]
MDLSALPLPPSRLALLHTAGYRKRSDLDGVIAATLAQKIGGTAAEAARLLANSLVACRPEERGAREEALRGLTCEGVLSGIHVFRCHDLAELVAAVKGLCAFAEGRSSRVRLVVVDSVAFHFRHENLPFARRLQLLGTVSQALLDFARAERAAAVLVNQVTTKVNDATNDSFLAPALGESWADCRTKRVLLEWQGFDGVAGAWAAQEPKRQHTGDS